MSEFVIFLLTIVNNDFGSFAGICTLSTVCIKDEIPYYRYFCSVQAGYKNAIIPGGFVS